MNNNSKIDLKGLIGLGLCVVIGSGIWRDPLSWTNQTGPLALFAIIVSWLLFFTSGLSYAEVVSMFPKGGGPYSYVSGAMNKKWGVFLGLLYYLGYAVVGSLLAFLSATFTMGIFNLDSNIALILITAGYIILLTILAGFSTPKSLGKIVFIWVAIKILFLLLIAILSIINGNFSNWSVSGTSYIQFQDVLNNSLWALMGFEVVLIFSGDFNTENIDSGKKLALPKAIIIELFIILFINLFVTFGASMIGGIGALENQSQFELIASATGIPSSVLNAMAAFSSIGTTFAIFAVLISQIKIITEDYSVKKVFHKQIFGNFTNSTVITGIICLIFGLLMTILLGITEGAIINILVVIGLSSIIVSALIPAGIIGLYLRIKMPIIERPFKTPLYYIVFPLSIILGIYLLILNISGLF